jgi:hypothetical protein
MWLVFGLILIGIGLWSILEAGIGFQLSALGGLGMAIVGAIVGGIGYKRIETREHQQAIELLEVLQGLKEAGVEARPGPIFTIPKKDVTD